MVQPKSLEPSRDMCNLPAREPVRNTLEARQSRRVDFAWQAQDLVEAQYFRSVSVLSCRFRLAGARLGGGCVNMPKVSNVVAGAALCDMWKVPLRRIALSGLREHAESVEFVAGASLCDARNTLEACQSRRVDFAWQAQYLVEGCVNVPKVSKVVAGAAFCDALEVSKFEEVSYEMLVLELQGVRFGGRGCVSCGRRNTLEACQSCRVPFAWQAQDLVEVAFQISWQAQHFVTNRLVRAA
eukprot:s219_g3.t3